MTTDNLGHIPDDILSAYADDPASVHDRQGIEAHLAACVECWSRVDDFRLMATAFRDEETWWIVGELELGSGRLVRDYVARRDAEDADAVRMLEPLLESPYRFAYANVPRRKRFQTGGVVRLLCRAVREELDRDPLFAATLAETACFIADGLPDDLYPAEGVSELRGTAWKEFATVCRCTQRFDDAFDALKRAERSYRKLIDPEASLATVELTRASILWEQDRPGEALPMARSAAHRFAALRLTDRYFDAKEIEAAILHLMGNVEEACETYRFIYELADDLGDAEMKARAARNLGIAYRDQGRVGEASKCLLEALQLYEGLGQAAMVSHMRWSIARLLLFGGNAREASERLPICIEELRRLGMPGDAARAQLDLAEAMLIMERFEDVETVCAELVVFFRDAKMLTGATTAAAYLKEAAAARKLQRADIAHVRNYLANLQRSPSLPFAPPPEPPRT